MKKIVMILTNGFHTDVRVYKEAKYLVQKGFRVTILCWDRDCNNDLATKECIDGIRVIRFKIRSQYGTGYKQLFSFYRFLRCCRLYLKKNKHDYLHCHDIDGALIGAIVKKKTDKMVFDMHEVYEHGGKISTYLWRNLTKILIKKSIAALYVTSFYLNQDYKSVRNKLYELRNYPDISMVQPLPKEKSDYFRVAYHGKVRNQLKDFTALFEAVKELPFVKVDINGDGTDLKELVRIQNKYDNVSVNGPYDGIKDSSRLYANTDLLFCAYDPTDPNYQGDTEVVKFYEAIITGTPILVTTGIGMEKKILDKKIGLSCNTRKSEEVREAIVRLYYDKKLWNQFHNNELMCSNEYSWNKAVKVLDKIYY